MCISMYFCFHFTSLVSYKVAKITRTCTICKHYSLQVLNFEFVFVSLSVCLSLYLSVCVCVCTFVFIVLYVTTSMANAKTLKGSPAARARLKPAGRRNTLAFWLQNACKLARCAVSPLSPAARARLSPAPLARGPPSTPRHGDGHCFSFYYIEVTKITRKYTTCSHYSLHVSTFEFCLILCQSACLFESLRCWVSFCAVWCRFALFGVILRCLMLFCTVWCSFALLVVVLRCLVLF